jgi:UDP:flavonoid glycosyltransferase YjiC (YdhE family)
MEGQCIRIDNGTERQNYKLDSRKRGFRPVKIVLATFGSRGDVQPMLALSLGLQSKGHKVLLAAPPEKAPWAEKLGCPFHPLGSNVTAFIDDMENAHSFTSAVRFLIFLRNEIKAQFDLLPQITAGADLVIGSSLVFAMATVAESMKIEYRYIAFTPQLLPSGYHPFPAFKHQSLPGWGNRMTWRIAKILDQFNIARLINNKRIRLGLKSIQDAWSNIMGRHVLVASDRAIAEVPPDVVSSTYTQTGYMHLEQPEQHVPELEKFLQAGPPPIFAGFGSMPKKDQIHNLTIIVKAIRACGQRAVIGKFWDEPFEFTNSNDIFFIAKYPHRDLFPRMAAVIHHGGAGTTASSAISGVPQIIVPHVLDQYYWGHQVYKAGLGPRPVWRSELTSRKLEAAILQCLANERIRQKAGEVSGIIKQKDSLEYTVGELMQSL